MHYDYILEKGVIFWDVLFFFFFCSIKYFFFFDYKMKRCTHFFLPMFAQLAADLRLEMGVIAFKTALINMTMDRFKGGFNLVSKMQFRCITIFTVGKTSWRLLSRLRLKVYIKLNAPEVDLIVAILWPSIKQKIVNH